MKYISKLEWRSVHYTEVANAIFASEILFTPYHALLLNLISIASEFVVLIDLYSDTLKIFTSLMQMALSPNLANSFNLKSQSLLLREHLERDTGNVAISQRLDVLLV